VKARRLVPVAIASVVAALLSYWAGYRHGEYHWPSDGRPYASGITLAKVLRQRGVAPEIISYLRFIGDESSFTTGRLATNTTDTAWIWDRMIETAEPYVYWQASGYRRIEIYTHAGPQPAVTLYVNETDATSVAGDGHRFMCHGLHDLAMRLLSPPQTAEARPLPDL
jgi:hypothetical protein